MNEDEYIVLEQELRHQRPAAPPPELMGRLKAAQPARPPPREQVRPRPSFWPLVVRWLVPATALVVVGMVVWRVGLPVAPPPGGKLIAESAPAVAADDIELGWELIRSFDTVARLPSGEPVRFRCSEWMDEMIVRDKDRNVVIEQRTPRVEVIPVRFETY